MYIYVYIYFLLCYVVLCANVFVYLKLVTRPNKHNRGSIQWTANTKIIMLHTCAENSFIFDEKLCWRCWKYFSIFYRWQIRRLDAFK